MSEDQFSITRDVCSNVLEALFIKLHENYVFPEVAQAIEESLRQRLESGEYDNVDTGELFCLFLTAHLQEISHDRHLWVTYRVKKQSGRKNTQEDSGNAENEYVLGSIHNFGFQKVERLPGNIGYLDLRSFDPPGIAGETAVAAMNFLAHTSALIIDLRYNDGGEPSMVALLASYLFDSEPVHLNDFYWRAQDSMQQFWTLPYVPGKRYGNRPVYVLTSRRTASAAEEFAYDLKNLKRAVLIGEMTAGGAHPIETYRIHPHFDAIIPTWRAINPVTGTNWEGTGVVPDIAVPEEDALKVAQVEALQKILENPGGTSTKADKALMKEVQILLKGLISIEDECE